LINFNSNKYFSLQACGKCALKIQKMYAQQALTKICVEIKYLIYHTGNGGIAAWIEDDFCDDINNKEECYYDGGDCCGLSVQNNFCVDCMCKCK
jgi:hypothetical protein